MITVQMVSVPGCTHCAAAKRIFDEVKPQFPDMHIEEIDATTPQGMDLVIKHGILSSPGIIINDELFATGGLDKNKFVKKLDYLKVEPGGR